MQIINTKRQEMTIIVMNKRKATIVTYNSEKINKNLIFSQKNEQSSGPLIII
jgi:hypothetical protein